MIAEKRKATLSIEMDQLGNFEIRFSGDNKLRLPMIGSLEFARDYLKTQILSSSGISEAETCRKNESEYNMGHIRTASKTEALTLYMDAFETIQARLQAIAGSDDRTTYEVPDFLKTL